MKARCGYLAGLLTLVGITFPSAYYLNGTTIQSVPIVTPPNSTDACTESVWDPDTLNDVYALPFPKCPSSLVLLVLVTSAPPNSPRRRAIRLTWGRSEAGLWKTLFLLGRDPDPDWVQREIEEEAAREGDLVRGNYVDSYRNLTLKVIHGFNFAYTSCPSLFILKTDDDCFVQTSALFRFLTSLPPHRANQVYAGRKVPDTTVIRNQHSRWYVASAQYSAQHYAPYASGTGYVISRDVLERVVRLFPCVRPFPNEDAFVGTIIGQRLNVVLEPSDRFTPFTGGWTLCNLLYLFVIHGVPPHLQKRYQREAQTAPDLCAGRSRENILWQQVWPEKKKRHSRTTRNKALK